MPKGWYFGRVSMVANDLQSNVYVLHRNGDIDPLVVFDAEGNYLRSWGKGVIDDPHGVRVDRENHVWVVDRAGAILKYTTDGKLLMTIGTKGVRGNDDKSFGSPTDLDWDSQGNIYIADGYGNSRVAKFDKTGKYVMSWGTPGSGPEPVPHGALDSVRLEGSRVCERPREQPHPDFRHQRQAAEDLEPSRLDAGHLDLAERRDVHPDAPQQRREHHGRHAGRPADEDRSRKRESARLDGIAGALGERLAERRHLRRQPDGECAALDAAPGVHALSLTQRVSLVGQRAEERGQNSRVPLLSLCPSPLTPTALTLQNPGVSENPQIHPRPGRSNGLA